MGKYLSVKERIVSAFLESESFSLKEAYSVCDDKPSSTVRGRIYDNIGKSFEKISSGVYKVINNGSTCLLLEGDGRNPQALGVEPNSVDLIITDHPWMDKKSNKGGNRDFSQYKTFSYSQEDMDRKAALLKDGCFLVEILPAENENNYEALYNIKTMAKKAGLNYYALVDWKKGDFVANTGRKAKNTESVMIFVKGKARALRPDVKKNLAEPGKEHFMSGSATMLPTVFDIPIVPKKERLHQAEKPVKLFTQLIECLSKVGETVLDQFAGSGAVGAAALECGRNCILIEECKETISTIIKRLNLQPA